MRLISLLLALGMGMGFVGTGGTPTAAKSGSPAPREISLTVAPAGSGILRPDSDLSLSASVTNTTSEEIPAGTASVYLDRSRVVSRSALSSWLSDTADHARPRASTEVFQAPSPSVPAGETRTLYLSVPTESLGLSTSRSAWGVHAIRLRIASGASEIAEASSTIVWYPGGSLTTTELALVAPVAAPPSTSGLISADDLATMTGTAGVLTRELDQALDRRIALAIDPKVIASIRILGTSAPPSARDWLRRLERATNDSFPLSYADSDLAAMSQSSGDLLTPTDFPIDPTLFPEPQPSGSPAPTPTNGAPAAEDDQLDEPTLPTSQTILDWDYTLPDVAWPLENSVVAKDLDVFAKAGLTTSLLASSNVSFGSGHAPGASATVGGHSVLVADAEISQLFRTAVLANSMLTWQQAMSALSASLAVVTQENGSSPGAIVATLGRNYPDQSYRLSETLTALSSLPWVTSSTLSEVAAAPPVTAAITGKPETQERVSQTEQLFSAEDSVRVFSAVLQQPTLLTGPRRLDLLSTLSSGWATNGRDWKSSYKTYLDESRKLTQSVTIVESSSIIQPSDKISLPVTVRNDLDLPVDVIIAVHSPSGILQVVDTRVPLTVEANSQAGARIAVQSVANGDVQLRVTLSAKDGTPIATPSFVDVDVQAQWETAITVVIAALLLAIFGFGIWRNVVKRRRARRARDTSAEQASPAEPTTTETARD